MNAGALGCEIVISGKLTGARSRTEKIVEGYIKHAGKPVDDIVDEGFAVAIKKLGTLGCKVRIIPPGAVLPDSFKLKDIAPEPVSEVAKAQPKAGIEKLVTEEASGEVAEAEEALEEEPVKKIEGAAPEKEVSETESSSAAAPESTEVLENEERREIDGVWQHKHAGHDYWHPIARIHREG